MCRLLSLVHGLTRHSWHLYGSLVKSASSLHHLLKHFLVAGLDLCLVLFADDGVLARMVSDREKVGLRVEPTVWHWVEAFLVVRSISVVVLQALIHVEGVAV